MEEVRKCKAACVYPCEERAPRVLSTLRLTADAITTVFFVFDCLPD